MGGDDKAQAVVVKIVSGAFAGAASSVQKACAAARTGLYAQAAHNFHVLRGTVGTVGTRRFVSAALAVELAMLEQRFEQLVELLSQVEQEFDAGRRQADAWLTSHGFPPAPP